MVAAFEEDPVWYQVNFNVAKSPLLRTFQTIQLGQNHLLSPSSTLSMGGSRHHKWKARGHPSQ